MTGLVVLLIVLAIVVVLALVGVGLYNGLIRLRNVVQESWRQIDVELNRRHDLIPNLVETVKGYASHERETLQAVTNARAAAAAPGSSPAPDPSGTRSRSVHVRTPSSPRLGRTSPT